MFTGSVPAAAAERFKYVASGVVLAVKDADLAQLPALHKSQLVLVQENAQGQVQNATTAQLAGALDDLYAAAKDVPDLGVAVTGIAGPGGATPGKPVGTVWLALARRDTAGSVQVHAERLQWRGDRAAVREQTLRLALRRLRDATA